MENLTEEIIFKYWFKKVNNSTYRNDIITLQSGNFSEGSNLIDTKRGYKACINGKFYKVIYTEIDLLFVFRVAYNSYPMTIMIDRINGLIK